MKIKTLKKPILLTFLTLLISASSAFAQGGADHGHGGGEVNEKGVIWDLADPNVGLTYTAESVVNGLNIPFLKKGQKIDVQSVFDSIKPYHHYFAVQLQNRFYSMRFRMTKHLRPLNTSDKDGFTYTPTKTNKRLAGIRVLDQNLAVLDIDVMKTLTLKQMAFVLIHETMHSFISVGIPGRNDNLRNLGYLIFSIYDGQRLEKVDYLATLQSSGVETYYGKSFDLLGRIADPSTRKLTVAQIQEVVANMPEILEQTPTAAERTNLFEKSGLYSVLLQPVENSNLGLWTNPTWKRRILQMSSKGHFATGACYVTMSYRKNFYTELFIKHRATNDIVFHFQNFSKKIDEVRELHTGYFFELNSFWYADSLSPKQAYDLILNSGENEITKIIREYLISGKCDQY